MNGKEKGATIIILPKQVTMTLHDANIFPQLVMIM